MHSTIRTRKERTIENNNVSSSQENSTFSHQLKTIENSILFQIKELFLLLYKTLDQCSLIMCLFISRAIKLASGKVVLELDLTNTVDYLKIKRIYTV